MCRLWHSRPTVNTRFICGWREEGSLKAYQRRKEEEVQGSHIEPDFLSQSVEVQRQVDHQRPQDSVPLLTAEGEPSRLAQNGGHAAEEQQRQIKQTKKETCSG